MAIITFLFNSLFCCGECYRKGFINNSLLMTTKTKDYDTKLQDSEGDNVLNFSFVTLVI